jgi:ATP-dependent DNA helicase RecG
MAAIDESLALERPMQRLLMGEVGSGKDRRGGVRDAARGRVGRPGRVMAPTETLAEAALRHAAEADAGRARPGRAADRLDARGRRADLLGKLGVRRAEAAGRHARA